MESKMRRLLSACHRFAYAALVSALVWIFAQLPMQMNPPELGARILLVLDWPIAVATQVLPCREFAVDLWYAGAAPDGCPQGFANQVSTREWFFNHMRVGIPVYLFLFYVPDLLAWLRRRVVGDN